MKIPFSHDDRAALEVLLDRAFDSSQWSNGPLTREFEECFSTWCGIEGRSVSGGGPALLSILEYINVKGKEVILPANTFYATALAVRQAGGLPVYADCTREDLCIDSKSIEAVLTTNTRAIIVVHIGGHIAFDIEGIAELCQKRNIALVEDCAHAHGATFRGKAAGSWGIAGAYSFYATKTLPTGDGGMVVSHDRGLLDFVESFRDYGKVHQGGSTDYHPGQGFHFRMSELNAALGVVQMKKIDEILSWKRTLAAKYDRIFLNHVNLPEGMVGGYYKYIVFDTPLTQKTGSVYQPGDLPPQIEGLSLDPFPGTRWISRHHSCAPIYFGWEHAHLPTDELQQLLVSPRTAD